MKEDGIAGKPLSGESGFPRTPSAFAKATAHKSAKTFKWRSGLGNKPSPLREGNNTRKLYSADVASNIRRLQTEERGPQLRRATPYVPPTALEGCPPANPPASAANEFY